MKKWLSSPFFLFIYFLNFILFLNLKYYISFAIIPFILFFYLLTEF